MSEPTFHGIPLRAEPELERQDNRHTYFLDLEHVKEAQENMDAGRAESPLEALIQTLWDRPAREERE